MDEELEIIKDFIADYPDHPIAIAWDKLLNEGNTTPSDYYIEATRIIESDAIENMMTLDQITQYYWFFLEGE